MQSRQLRRAAERQAIKQAIKEARKHQNTPAAASTSRAEINRENARHSTGPKTPEGKAASSQNAFKHGLYSKAIIFPGENPAELDALKADLRAEHQPANTTEEILVNEMAEQFWRIRRWREREACIMQVEDSSEAMSAFIVLAPILQRLMTAAERGFHKALTALRQLQKHRGFVPQFSEAVSASAPADAGFVSQGTAKTKANPTPFEQDDSFFEAQRAVQDNIYADLSPGDPQRGAKSA